MGNETEFQRENWVFSLLKPKKEMKKIKYGPYDERIERLAVHHGINCTQCTLTNISSRESKLVQ